jgi:uncharacterized phage protein (TIGR02218 family)
MSYQALETSVETGNPVELYEFAIGIEVFRYTSSQLPYVLPDLTTYSPVVISRGSLEASAGDRSADRLEVRASASNEFVRKYIAGAPGLRATLTLKRIHRGDGAQETVVVFKGTVRNVAFTKDGREAIMQCLPLTSAINRTIPRLGFSGLCGHLLYDARCKIDLNNASFKFTGTVSAVSGKTITVTGAGAFGGALTDFFVAGYAEFQNDFRMIIAQSTDVMTLSLPFGASPIGASVVLRAGCKLRLAEDCVLKFSNKDNYGGFPFVPKRDIFRNGIQ